MAVIARKSNVLPGMAELARLPKFHLHDLQHTHAAHLQTDDWSPTLVSRPRRRGTPAITQQLYAHTIAGVPGDEIVTPVAFAPTGTASSR